MTKAIARLIHHKKCTAARTYEEFENAGAEHWHEGQPLYTISDAQLRNIARELDNMVAPNFAKIYRTIHEALRA